MLRVPTNIAFFINALTIARSDSEDVVFEGEDGLAAEGADTKGQDGC